MTSPLEPAPKPRSISPPESAERALARIARGDLPTETVELARYLIGAVLVSDVAPGRTAVRIVETEAYLADDAAAHSYRGETERNRSLFLRPGHAYVYLIYGMYFCMNVSSEAAGVGAGVLIRAGEPLVGLELMRARRPRSRTFDLCRGPGRLATALAIEREHDGCDLLAPGPLWLATPLGSRPAIVSSPRIGITKETERVLRFFEGASPYASGSRRQNRSGA